MPKTIHLICAARPNFMKIAPLYHELKKQSWCNPVIIHTGQHYDFNMSDAFFIDLNLPEPVHLGVGSGSHAAQTAGVMVEYEKYALANKPDLIVVVGDVNATMAVAITAKKLHLQVAHLEAGLRSRDMDMPEEVNRLVTDALADLLWTPSRDGDENLKAEGVPSSKISFVGNIMIDSYEMLKDKIKASTKLTELALTPQEFAILTLHRPSNVDDKARLEKILDELLSLSNRIQFIFPIHPRTRKQLETFNLMDRVQNSSIKLIDPLGYKDFMKLVTNSRFALTDSGGVQEETSYLNIPCLTLRENTERPITVTHGSNELIHLENLKPSIEKVLNGQGKKTKTLELWDGKTAGRVTSDIARLLQYS